MTKLGFRRVGLTLLVALMTTPAALHQPAAGAPAPVKPGKYAGNVIEDGQPSTKEWLRFRVATSGRKVTSYESRVWVVCYEYPNTYYQLPVVFSAPAARIDADRKVEKSWTEPYTVDGVEYTLTGRLELKFKPGGRVTGQVSIDFASCATRTGDPPYFVPLKAKHV
jgi:hypothetical protein